MVAPATPLPINKDAQAAVVKYLHSAQAIYTTTYNIRNILRMQDLAYYREQDLTEEQLRARFANQTGDANKMQNITIPVVMPQVETALSYLADVYLTGFPIFGTVAPPGQEAVMKQFDTVMIDNSIKFKWVSELMKTLRDGLKHDLGAVEVTWAKEKIFSVQTPELTSLEEGTPQEELYQGNKIKHLDVYNLILDPRVSPDENHEKGEFAGYTEMLSRIQLKKELDDLDRKFTMNFTDAFECGTSTVSTSAADATYYIPQINPFALIQPSLRQEHDWMQWAGLAGRQTQRIAYRNSYERTVLYARILPSDFGMRVPNANQIQIWKFIIINRQVVIYAERQTNAHNMLPIVVCKPSNDGMSWQSKSMVDDALPAQQISTSLMNSAIASQRRKVYDRMLYDPTKVRKEDIDRIDPVARIPVKNSQFGKGFEGAVQPLPYNDNNVAEVLQLSQQITAMGDITTGQNRVQQGQFQKGNKTRREFETVMVNANSRQKMKAISLECTFFTPIKEIIKANMLQYQPATDIVNPQSGEQVTVNPTDLRKALVSFTMSDGMLATEKIAALDVVGSMIQLAGVVPQIAAEYDLGGILNRTWALQGANWLDEYKRNPTQQADYLQQVAAHTTASGNMKQPPQPIPDAGAQGAV